jgi:hypothetical protein
MLHIWLQFSKQIWKNVEWAKNVYVNVTYVTDVLKINMKNVEWDKCIRECNICDWCSQNKYEKCWVRQMFM